MITKWEIIDTVTGIAHLGEGGSYQICSKTYFSSFNCSRILSFFTFFLLMYNFLFKDHMRTTHEVLGKL